MFFVAGIILFALVGFLFYVRASYEERSFEVSESIDVKSVTSFVNFCLQQKGEEALVDVAGKGGYFALPVYSTEQLPNNLPYFLYQGSVFVPTIEKVQENVARAVEMRLGGCLNFTSFQGVDISVEGIPEVMVVFGSEEMRVTLHQKIVVQKEQNEIRLESFSTTVPAIFLGLYEHTKMVVGMQKNFDGGVCMSCNMLVGLSTGFLTETMATGEGIVYVIRKPGDSLLFRFARM